MGALGATMTTDRLTAEPTRDREWFHALRKRCAGIDLGLQPRTMCLQRLSLLLELADFAPLGLQVMTSHDCTRRHDSDREYDDECEPKQRGRREAAAVEPVHALRVDELATNAQAREKGARHPGATLVEELRESGVGACRCDEGGALGVCEQQRGVFARTARRKFDRRQAEVVDPVKIGCAAVGIGAHHDFSAASQRLIGEGFEIAHHHCRSVTTLEKNVSTGVDANEHRAVCTDVPAQRAQVLAVVVATHDDEHLLASELGSDLRHAHTVEEQVAVAPQVLHGVGRERLKLDGQAGTRIGHRVLHCFDRLLLPRRDHAIAGVQGAFVEPDDVAVANLGEHAGSDTIEERYAVGDQNLRPEVGIAAADARCGVDDCGNAALDERLSRQPVDIDVVDDGDVAGP